MRLRHAIPATLLLATTCRLLAATNETAAAPAEPFAEVVVALTLNGASTPVALVVRRDTDGTLLLRAVDFATLHLRTPARGGVQVNGERYYRLGAELGAVVHFDVATQSVELQLPPAAFLDTHRDGSTADAPPVDRSGLGGFVNYDVSAQQSDRARQGGALLELGLFGANGVATSTMVAQLDDQRRSATRLETTWTRDFPERLATLRVGDAISTPGPWGHAVRFGGVQFGTNFGTQPTLVSTPLLAAQGEAIVPSTVDVFVNGRHVANADVPPGPFSIDHLPAITGSGQLQVVVTDVLGRQQVVSQPYYSGSSLLRPGLADYSVELGSLRQEYGTQSFDYGDLLTTASYRRGLTDTVTAGSRVEAQSDGTFALGADVAWLAGPVGIVTADGATGGHGDQAGGLGGVGIERDGARVSLFAHTQYASRSFRQVGAESLERTPRQRAFAGVGLDLARFGSVQLAGGMQTYYDDEPVQTLGLTYGLALGSYGYLSMFATRAVSTDAETTVLLSWTLPLGQRSSASTAVQRSATAAGDSLEAYASFQHDLPTDTGPGYRVSLSTSDEQDAGIAYRGHAGVATLEYAQRNGTSGLRLDANGGLALTSAGVLPARRLDRSFAVVQVADYPGLTVYLDNQPVGSTDAHGRVLVETLRPYERNQVALDPKQVPMDGSLAQASIDVVPAYRSGAVVRFPVTRALAATMRLVQRDGGAVPAGATATVNARPFPVALDGLLYVEGLAAETAIDVHWVGGQCRFVARRPTGEDAIPDLGTLRCE